MVLSKRLWSVSSLVTEGSRLADIGTDHGYVPVFLVEEGRIPSAIAMDVNPGPLERAREHIRQHALQDRIETRLSDGLDALGKDEADTVLIAGMGGALCVRILEARPALHSEVKELVLQPQSEIFAVRRYLEGAGWQIVQEKMVLEDGKYYQMMRCIPGKMNLTALEEKYGPCLMKEGAEEWIGYLRWRRQIQERTLAGLARAQGERGEKRRREAMREAEELDALLDRMGRTTE